MDERPKMLKQGAEAKIYVCNYLGRPTIIKERFKKTYRQPELDATITKERIKNEARAMVRCKAIGLRIPALYLVDFERRRIYMEHFEYSLPVKDYISDISSTPRKTQKLNIVANLIGKNVRKMHENNIIHGDLTTSNMLQVYKEPVSDYNLFDLAMIDFGLSYIDSSAEDKGVDLYVLERALISTHNDVPGLFPKILEAYKESSTSDVKEVMNKLEEVRARGRKRTMIG